MQGQCPAGAGQDFARRPNQRTAWLVTDGKWPLTSGLAESVIHSRSNRYPRRSGGPLEDSSPVTRPPWHLASIVCTDARGPR